ncbi:MAG: hypothetical protein DRG40_00930 [Deltaproteobacteria bacterium]|nr:MAG: hypothetical protein DRG40_00930 [Deltaproteobacteria bacterium]
MKDRSFIRLLLFPILLTFASIFCKGAFPSEPLADLTIGEVRFSPPRGRPGGEVKVSVEVINLGKEPIKGIEVRGATKETGWREKEELKKLGGREKRTVIFRYTVPQGARGTITFQFSVWGEGESRKRRNNNFRTAYLTIIPPSSPVGRPPVEKKLLRKEEGREWRLEGVRPAYGSTSPGDPFRFELSLIPPRTSSVSGCTVTLLPSTASCKGLFKTTVRRSQLVGGKWIIGMEVTPTYRVRLGTYDFQVAIVKGRRVLWRSAGGPKLCVHGPPFARVHGPAVPGELVVTLRAKGVKLRGTLRRWEKEYGVRALEVVELKTIGLSMVRLALPEGVRREEIIRALSRDPSRPLPQPNYTYRSCSSGADPLLPLQYGLKMIGTTSRRGARGRGIKVAVVDTGIDSLHEDLKGGISGEEDLLKRGDFHKEIHGTALAGIIAARCHNGVGICGVAPEAEVLAIRVCRPISAGRLTATTTTFLLAQGIDRAVLLGARVVNLSLGGPHDPLIGRLIKVASSQGVVFVAAAGDRGLRVYPPYPAALPEVIAVGAVDKEGRPYSEGLEGRFIDLCAPGVDIISTAPGNRYNFFNGTSMASAFVSGVVALVLQENPNLTPEGIGQLLRETAHDLGPHGKDEQFGWGLLQVKEALDFCLELPRK